jgi:hypothetical protein
MGNEEKKCMICGGNAKQYGGFAICDECVDCVETGPPVEKSDTNNTLIACSALMMALFALAFFISQ